MSLFEKSRGLPTEVFKNQKNDAVLEEKEGSAISVSQFIDRLKTDRAIEKELENDSDAEAQIRVFVKKRLDEGQTASKIFEEISELLPKLLKIEEDTEAVGVKPEKIEEKEKSSITPKIFIKRLKSDPNIKEALDEDPQATSILMDIVKDKIDNGQPISRIFKSISELLPKLINVEMPDKLSINEVKDAPPEPKVEYINQKQNQESGEQDKTEKEILLPDLANFDANDPKEIKQVANEYLSEGLKDYPDAYKYFRELSNQLGKDRSEIMNRFSEDTHGLIRNQLEAIKNKQQTVEKADQAIRKLINRKLEAISIRKAA